MRESFLKNCGVAAELRGDGESCRNESNNFVEVTEMKADLRWYRL
jgi:hypothetical protein